MDIIARATTGDYAITLNGCNSVQYFDSPIDERISKVLTHYSKTFFERFRPYFEYAYVVEISMPQVNQKDSRIHVHGVLFPRSETSIVEFYMNEWNRKHQTDCICIKKLGFVKHNGKGSLRSPEEENPEMDSVERWINYCKKDHEMMEKFLTSRGFPAAFASKDSQMVYYNNDYKYVEKVEHVKSEESITLKW